MSSVANAGMPSWANINGAKVPALRDPDLAGGGIYACFWDDRLVYIGSFVGPEANPYGGQVADRIYKHVIGFTLRARNLSFSAAPLRAIIANLDHEIARDLETAQRNGAWLERGSIKATYNKARFAALHWNELRDASPETLLDRFTFAYRRIVPPPQSESKHAVKEGRVKPLEKTLIRRFEPICNTEFRIGPDGTPAALEEVRDVFESVFAKASPPSLATTEVSPFGAQTSEALGVDPDDFDDDEAEQVSPSDPRWQEYYTDKGQLRVRATSKDGRSRSDRVLLCRESNGTVLSLANPSQLKAAGIEARAVRRGPMSSAVVIDFTGDPGKCADQLRTVLELSLSELHSREEPRCSASAYARLAAPKTQKRLSA